MRGSGPIMPLVGEKQSRNCKFKTSAFKTLNEEKMQTFKLTDDVDKLLKMSPCDMKVFSVKRPSMLMYQSDSSIKSRHDSMETKS
jgi:hypothetical protein